MKQEFIVLGVSRFDGDIDGKHFHSGKLRVLGEVPPQKQEDSKGLIQSIVKCDYELFDTVSKFPAVYDVELALVGQDLYANSLKFVSEVKLPLLDKSI